MVFMGWYLFTFYYTSIITAFIHIMLCYVMVMLSLILLNQLNNLTPT